MSPYTRRNPVIFLLVQCEANYSPIVALSFGFKKYIIHSFIFASTRSTITAYKLKNSKSTTACIAFPPSFIIHHPENKGYSKIPRSIFNFIDFVLRGDRQLAIKTRAPYMRFHIGTVPGSLINSVWKVDIQISQTCFEWPKRRKITR